MRVQDICAEIPWQDVETEARASQCYRDAANSVVKLIRMMLAENKHAPEILEAIERENHDAWIVIGWDVEFIIARIREKIHGS